MIVHHFYIVRSRIPLDVQRFGSFLDGKVSGCRFEIIVIRLPHHRRPAGMAHPHQQSHTVLAARLEEAAMPIVVHPLSQISKFFGTLWLTVSRSYDLIKRRCALCPFQSIVVHTPLMRLRPDAFGGIGTQKTLISQHVGHASLAVELVVTGLQCKVGFGRKHTVRTVTAHYLIGRTGNIMKSRVFFLYDTAQSLVDSLGWETLVTSAIQSK